jgi:hypothetical protein
MTFAQGGVAKRLRQWSAKPLFIGSIPIAASTNSKGITDQASVIPFFVPAGNGGDNRRTGSIAAAGKARQ